MPPPPPPTPPDQKERASLRTLSVCTRWKLLSFEQVPLNLGQAMLKGENPNSSPVLWTSEFWSFFWFTCYHLLSTILGSLLCMLKGSVVAVSMIARAECVLSFLESLPCTLAYMLTILKKRRYIYLFYLLTWLHQILVAEHGIQFPDQELNPGSLHCERGALATGSVHFKLSSILSCWFPDVNSNKEYLKVAFPLQFCWYSFVHVSTLTSELKVHRQEQASQCCQSPWAHCLWHLYVISHLSNECLESAWATVTKYGRHGNL